MFFFPLMKKETKKSSPGPARDKYYVASLCSTQTPLLLVFNELRSLGGWGFAGVRASLYFTRLLLMGNFFDQTQSFGF